MKKLGEKNKEKQRVSSKIQSLNHNIIIPLSLKTFATKPAITIMRVIQSMHCYSMNTTMNNDPATILSSGSNTTCSTGGLIHPKRNSILLRSDNNKFVDVGFCWPRRMRVRSESTTNTLGAMVVPRRSSHPHQGIIPRRRKRTTAVATTAASAPSSIYSYYCPRSNRMISSSTSTGIDTTTTTTTQDMAYDPKNNPTKTKKRYASLLTPQQTKKKQKISSLTGRPLLMIC